MPVLEICKFWDLDIHYGFCMNLSTLPDIVKEWKFEDKNLKKKKPPKIVTSYNDINLGL